MRHGQDTFSKPTRAADHDLAVIPFSDRTPSFFERSRPRPPKHMFFSLFFSKSRRNRNETSKLFSPLFKKHPGGKSSACSYMFFENKGSRRDTGARTHGMTEEKFLEKIGFSKVV
jgi:hypothetical protein